MTTITIQEAQSRLSDLIHNLSPGDELIITENNQPVARLVPTAPAPAKKPPQFGTLKGTVLSMEHFDDPLEDFEEYM